jgi:flagellar assembly protein FliH
MINLSKNVIKAEDVKIISRGEEASGTLRRMGLKSGKNNLLEGKENGIGHHASESPEQSHGRLKEAYDKGFSDGLKDGQAGTRDKLASAFSAVEKLTEELRKARNELWGNAEKEILALSLVMAEKVIHREVTTDNEIIVAVLKDAMARIQNKENMKIKLNPADYNYIIEAKPDVLSMYCTKENLILEKDDKIKQGGAVIETRHATIDAQIEQQLERIREALS